VLYLAPPSTPLVRDLMAQRADLCAIRTPLQGNRVPDGTRWAADNGCFGDGFPGYGKWIGWLEGHAEHADRALFATAPDVFRPDLGRGDAKATLKRSLPWLPAIRALGYPTAFVAQEGSENPGLIPWELVDVVFIGGGDEWKLGRGSQLVVDEALRRGRRVHMGRVNSLERLASATKRGIHTADGTYSVFAPDKNIRDVCRWLDIVNGQLDLFAVGIPNQGGGS
jgi:hypothetical protein